jgi:hypothetical protein
MAMKSGECLTDYIDDVNEADHKDGFEDSNDLFEDNGDDEVVMNEVAGIYTNSSFFVVVQLVLFQVVAVLFLKLLVRNLFPFL